MLEVKNVSKSYGKTVVLHDVSFRVDPTEFVCLTGPSGAGKSTIINLLIGAEDATSGSIEIDGVELRKVPHPAMQLFRRKVGVVFQDVKLLRGRTVAENIAFPLEACGASDAIIKKRVGELLEQVGLSKKANMLPAALSGGEKTRVAIARATVHKPIILLADEPTGNIDPEQALKIMSLFKQIHLEKTTIILATHDSNLVDSLKTRVIRLEEGRIVRDSVGGYFDANGHKGTKEHPAHAGDAASKIKITSIGS